MRMISLDALVGSLKKIKLHDLSDGQGLCVVIFKEDLEACIRNLEASSISDVAPVRRGKWTPTYNYYYDVNRNSKLIADGFICSKCRHQSANSWHFCPNCGAKMEDR